MARSVPGAGTGGRQVEHSTVLVCPGCHAVLLEHDARLDCRECGRTWPVRNGVAQFVDDHPYRGVIPQPHMSELLRRTATGSWKEAVADAPEASVQHAADAILNLDRASWYRLTDLRPASRVLDVGAGMGATSHALAKRFSEVVALEPVLEAVEFMRYRFLQERLGNVVCVQGSVWEVPFPPESFDLVVLNGVLEWVAEGREGNPKSLQQEALARVFELVRPGGYVYLGVDNRVSWRSLLGTPDAHCGLPFIALLPRPLAALYASIRGRAGGYRNYTYTARGYRRLLARAGFGTPQCYAAIPSYNFPRFYVPMDERIFSYYSANFDPVRSGFLAGVVHWFFGKIGVSQYLQNSFILLAKKESQ
jgi:SAM-dependent methyltransferase